MTALLKIGLVSVSDRASQGVYPDQGIPELKNWLEQALVDPFEVVERLIPDEQPEIERTLCKLVDEEHCHLVLTTGGTGPAKRDVTPDATLAVADREMPGFGEQMRQVSLHFCADRHSFPSSRRDSQRKFDFKFTGAAESHQRNIGRRKR